MGYYKTITCPKCGGAKFLDDHYDSDCGKWIQRNCPECNGLGEVSVWTEDNC